MKNRRNTRRGRAKRWARPPAGETMWELLRTDVSVCPSLARAGSWIVCSVQHYFDTGRFVFRTEPSRAAAMRAAMRNADFLARRR